MQINKIGLKAAGHSLTNLKCSTFPDGFTQGSAVWAANSAGLFTTLPTGRGVNNTRRFKPREGVSQSLVGEFRAAGCFGW